jgi:uncharacterized protein YndB with AHSA1/START domain
MSRTTFQPSPLAEVACRTDRQRWTLVFVRVLPHSPAKVWTALTDPGQLRAWAPFTADRDLGRVGAATLTMIDGDVSESSAAPVTRAERPSLLEYTWGTDLVRWQLAPIGSGTRLSLEHTVGDRQWVPKVAAGWHLCLDVAERLLAGQPVEPIRGEDAKNHGWERLHDAYAETLGIPSTGWPEDTQAHRP